MKEEELIKIDLHTQLLIKKFSINRYSRKDILNFCEREKIKLNRSNIEYYLYRFKSNISNKYKQVKLWL